MALSMDCGANMPKSADIHIRLSDDLKGRVLHKLKLIKQDDPDTELNLSGLVIRLLKDWLKAQKTLQNDKTEV